MNRQIDRKRAALAGAVGLVVLGMGLPARAVDLLINPGFEAPTVTGGMEETTATGWKFLPVGEEERVSTLYNPTFVRSGTWSVFQKIFDTTGSVQQTVGGLTAGASYTLSGWEYAEAYANTTGAMLDFRLSWENSMGVSTGESALQIPASSVSTSGWEQFTLSTSNYSTADSTVNGSTPGTPDGIVCIAPVAPPNTTQVLVSFDYNGPGAEGATLSTFLDDVDLEGPGTPPANTWAINGSGDWNAAANWASGAVPSGAGVEADLFSIITANYNVYSDIAITVGTINFNNANTYVIDGAGSLTLQGLGSANANVIVQAGTQEINLPLTIASNTVFNVSSGATLVIGNPTTVESGFSLTQTGLGTVTYNSIITLQSGASLSFGNSTYAHGLTLQGTGAATLTAHTGATPSVLQLDSLTGSTTSTLNLTNNALVVHGGSLSTIGNELKAGFNAGRGYWNGVGGIVSTTAAADTTHLTTLGYRQSAGGSFNGVSTTSSDVLVMYTYYGDANLDGSVNGADYQQIDAGFGGHLTGWQNGDFNYDGVVDGSDFSLIDNTFNQITAGGLSPLAILASPASLTAGPASVPEPATLSLLGLGIFGLLGRRRR